MKTLPDPASLRIFPLPYLQWRVSPQAITWSIDCVNTLKRESPQLKFSRFRQIRDKILVCLGFAECFSLEQQFEQNCSVPGSFVGNRPGDFTIPAEDGSEQFVSVIPSRVDPNFENVGPGTGFFIRSKELQYSPAEIYVLAAISMPVIQYVGWIAKDDAKKYIRSWSAKVLAASPSVRPMQSLPLEHQRKKSYYA